MLPRQAHGGEFSNFIIRPRNIEIYQNNEMCRFGLDSYDSGQGSW